MGCTKERLPTWLIGKDCLQCRREFDPWVGEIPWKRKWQPTPVFLLGDSHGQRSLGGYSPWGHKELDTAEVTQQQQQQYRDTNVVCYSRAGLCGDRGREAARESWCWPSPRSLFQLFLPFWWFGHTFIQLSIFTSCFILIYIMYIPISSYFIPHSVFWFFFFD